MTPDEQRAQSEELSRQRRISALQERPRSRTGSVLFGLLLVFALGAAATVLLLRGSGALATRLTSSLLHRSTTVDTSAPVVIEQIQRLNRLETVSVSVDTVVEGKRTSDILPDVLFGDRLLLIVHGEVLAGVDLSKLQPESVRIQGSSITVELPPSQVFATRLDEAKSRVFSRTTGLLTPTDPNLETDTRRTAQSQILDSAMADGILDKARGNARASIESLLHGLGFQHVTIR